MLLLRWTKLCAMMLCPFQLGWQPKCSSCQSKAAQAVNSKAKKQPDYHSELYWCVMSRSSASVSATLHRMHAFGWSSFSQIPVDRQGLGTMFPSADISRWNFLRVQGHLHFKWHLGALPMWRWATQLSLTLVLQSLIWIQTKLIMSAGSWAWSFHVDMYPFLAYHWEGNREGGHAFEH